MVAAKPARHIDPAEIAAGAVGKALLGTPDAVGGIPLGVVTAIARPLRQHDPKPPGRHRRRRWGTVAAATLARAKKTLVIRALRELPPRRPERGQVKKDMNVPSTATSGLRFRRSGGQQTEKEAPKTITSTGAIGMRMPAAAITTKITGAHANTQGMQGTAEKGEVTEGFT